MRVDPVFHPPYRLVHSEHGPVAIYDAVDVGFVARVKESLPHKRMLAEAMVAGLDAAAATERRNLPAGSQIRYDLPTRGNLAEALRDMDAAIDRALFDVQVAHDDGCPAIGIGGGCTCELVEVILTRSA